MLASLGDALLLEPRLAYAGTDGQIHIHHLSSGQTTCLTWGARQLTHGYWMHAEVPDRLRHYWPTWSPDGRYLACLGTYGLEGDEHGSALYAFDTRDGIQSWELWTGTTSAPIYVCWCPDNKRLTMVIEHDDALTLLLSSLETPGEWLSLASGLPLYHQYAPDGRFLAVQLGGKFNGEPGRRLYRINLATPDRRLALSEAAGLIGTPCWSPDGKYVAYTAMEDGDQAVTLVEPPRGPYLRLGSFPGRGWLHWHPDGQQVLASVGPYGGPPGHQALWAFSMNGTPPTVLLEAAFLCAQVLTDGRVLYLEQDVDSKRMTLRLLEHDHSTRTLFSFFPTQPQRFAYQHYHQYQLSHPMVSSDQQWLTCSGYLSEQEQQDDQTQPRVFVLSLEGGSERGKPEARVIGEGNFACWSLPPRQVYAPVD